MYLLGKHDGGMLSNCLVYSPNSRLLASAKSEDVKVWDLHQRREVREIDPGVNASSLAFAPDGRLIVSGAGEHAVRVFDPETGERLQEFPYSWCRAQCAFLSGDGKTLYCGGHHHEGSGDKVGRFLRWNPATGRQRKPFLDVEEDIGFAAESPDGRYLVGGGEKHTAWLWEVATRRLVHTFRCRPSAWRVVAFSPDGRTLVITAGRAVEVWDPETLKRAHTLRGHTATIWGLAFCPDGRLLTGGGDGTVRLWDTDSGRQLASLDWGIGPVKNVAVAPDGMTAAAGATGGEIVIWDLEES